MKTNFITFIFLISLGLQFPTKVHADEVVYQKADEVVEQSATDNVSAAKNAQLIFEAAKYAQDSGKTKKADAYYTKGLELTPWDLSNQLAYAQFLNGQGHLDKAKEKASLVYELTEDQKQLDEPGRGYLHVELSLFMNQKA